MAFVSLFTDCSSLCTDTIYTAAWLLL